MRKKKIPLLYHCTIFMLYYVCDLLTMPEDDEILKNGTVDFVSISYYSSNCVSVTQKGKITADGRLMFYWYKKVIESCGEKL